MKIKRSTLIHIIVWSILLLLPYIFTPHEANKDPEEKIHRIFITITTFFWAGLFYLNAAILTPKFLYRKKYIIYFPLLALLYGIVITIFTLVFSMLLPHEQFNLRAAAEWNVLPFLFTIMISTTYKTVYDKIQADALADEKQKENLKTELSFLRSQISPHFLFNVLNNLLSLIRLKSDEAEPTVLKLSSLIQYMLYETDEEKVMLTDEVRYLQSYIDLQQQRFGSRIKINVSMHADDNSNAIEPMLLIPFVENAFKHGVGLIDKPEINIELYSKADTLYFSVRNKYNAANIVKDKTSGIGLANVTRRLELLYGKEQHLAIEKDNNLYSISLQIKLK
jgi:two-component system LytT family sensor kinase